MTRALWLATLAAGVVALYLLRLDPAAGLYIDDGWYIVLAKALVQGDGYALISSAASPILPAFPPGFPLLLAPIVAMTAEFPANVASLKAVSMVAMLGIAIATYVFLVRYRDAPPWLAGAVALITVLTPAFVFLVTSTVMAECAFTLGQMALLLVVEHTARQRGPGSRSWLVAGAVIGAATVLIRAAGIAPLAAAGLYLLVKRGGRAAAGFALVTALCYAPWALYAAAHQPTPAERMAHGGAVAYGYAELLSMEEGGVAEGGRVGVAQLVSRVGANLVNVFGRDVGAMILPAAYRGPGESGLEVFSLSGETGLRAGSMGGGSAILWVSSGLSALTLIGFLAACRRGVTVAEVLVPLTIAMVAMVPNRTFRYVLPLAPLVVFYFLSGLASAINRLRLTARTDAAPQMGALCMLGLLGMEHAQYVWQVRNGSETPWLRDYREVQAVSSWMNEHLAQPGAVTTTNPPLVYLLTGRKTVAYVDVSASWPRWQGMGVRYAAAFHVTEQPPERLGYRVLFKSPQLGLWLLELPPARLTENASSADDICRGCPLVLPARP
jgi:hypothetical protein